MPVEIKTHGLTRWAIEIPEQSELDALHNIVRHTLLFRTGADGYADAHGPTDRDIQALRSLCLKLGIDWRMPMSD